MRRNVKVKAHASRVLLRNAATSATAAARRSFPAWITADDQGVAFPARAAIPRVRDGLVLRTISKTKSAKSKSSRHGPGAR